MLIMSLSKNKIKYIHSLKDKKHRIEHKTFVAEGYKMVTELLSHFECDLLLVTEEFMSATKIDLNNVGELVVVTNDELRKASFLNTPQQTLGIFRQPEYDESKINLKDNLIIALDGVQDPGNFGTIIRLADWYGIEDVICSKDTVDVYNPKTVQATMGALCRVKIHYVNVEEFISNNSSIPVYGTLLDGKNMYDETLTKNGIIVMGNEGNGIRPEVQKLIEHKLYIPNYPSDRETSESLNVAIATAIICSEFRRRSF